MANRNLFNHLLSMNCVSNERKPSNKSAPNARKKKWNILHSDSKNEIRLKVFSLSLSMYFLFVWLCVFVLCVCVNA